MELLKEIMKLAQMNIAVDYTILDQKVTNGMTDGSMPDKTYTVTISEIDSRSEGVV